MTVYKIYNHRIGEWYVRGTRWGVNGSVLTSTAGVKAVLNRLLRVWLPRGSTLEDIEVFIYELNEQGVIQAHSFLES